jgi:hypothetical protein
MEGIIQTFQLDDISIPVVTPVMGLAEIDKGVQYGVPNTVVVYTSNSWKHFDLRITRAATNRRVAKDDATKLRTCGFRVIENYEKADKKLFRSLWQTDGIVGFVFGGHGQLSGLNTGDGEVPPHYVFPPYKLGLLRLHACYSSITFEIQKGTEASGKPRIVHMSYRNHLARGGHFLGYRYKIDQLDRLYGDPEKRITGKPPW